MLSDNMDNKIERQAVVNGTPLPKGHSRLIDANALNEYEVIVDVGYAKARVVTAKAIENIPTVFTIPENPTNGDMIMALFPDISITEIGGGATIVVANDYKFNSTWWNAPYTGLNKLEPEIGRMM